MSERLWGKYRGVVSDNRDPMQLGRIRAMVTILGSGPSGWAMPCVPRRTSWVKGSALPEVGGSVWIEFEQGDPDSPIWSGCFYNSPAETPRALRY